MTYTSQELLLRGVDRTLVEMRRRRRQRGISQATIAEAMGLTEDYVYCIESGQKPVPKGFLDRYKKALEELKCQTP